MQTHRVKVLAGEKREGVVELSDGRLEVRVRAKREEGRANERALTLLAEHLGVERANVTITSGHAQSTKTVIVHSK